MNKKKILWFLFKESLSSLLSYQDSHILLTLNLVGVLFYVIGYIIRLKFLSVVVVVVGFCLVFGHNIAQFYGSAKIEFGTSEPQA